MAEKTKKTRKTVKQKNKELESQNKKIKNYGMKMQAFPTKDQQQKFFEFFGGHRFAFNFYLAERIEIYQNTGETLGMGEFKKAFNSLKNHPHFEWLKKIDKFALETGIEQVDDAYKKFFIGLSKFPKFKSKHVSKKTYTTKETNGNIEFDVENMKVKLPKVGWVKVGLSKKQTKQIQDKGFRGRITSATVGVHGAGKFYISLKIEEIIDIQPTIDYTNISEQEILGLDLGLMHFYIDSNGKKIDNPRTYKKSLQKIKKQQKALSRKKKGSANYVKNKKKLAKNHLKVINIRHDFLHQISRQLINENQVIVVEDLNVKGMIKNKKLAQSIADVSWSTFLTYLTYKADWANKKVIKIGRFFASSKQCHVCSEKNTALTLNERNWACGHCGAEHDRDENAAINIKNEGIRILKEAEGF